MRRYAYAVLATAGMLAGTAHAQSDQVQQPSSGFYTRFDTGPSFSTDAGGTLDNSLGTGGIGSIGLGYRFSPRFRTDLTLGYRGGYEVGGGANVQSSDVDAITGMVNGYVDLGTFGRFTPYVGAGIGASRNEVEDIRGTVGGASFRVPGDTRTSFAWQASAGTSVALSERTSLDLGYRYQDLGLVGTQPALSIGGVPVQADSADGHLRSHELQLGLRIHF
jgi:opacity protein-like surface antigen